RLHPRFRGDAALLRLERKITDDFRVRCARALARWRPSLLTLGLVEEVLELAPISLGGTARGAGGARLRTLGDQPVSCRGAFGRFAVQQRGLRRRTSPLADGLHVDLPLKLALADRHARRRSQR